MKKLPTKYDADVSMRIPVLSKATIKGECFMGTLIEYEHYTIEELKSTPFK